MIRHAHIIHGYQSAPDRHWFPWLAEKLAGQGIACTRIALPDAGRPDFGRWQQSLAEHIGQADEHHLLIAHSLGTPTLLHYLSRTAPERIGGIILAAAFEQTLPALPELDGYLARLAIDFAAIRRACPNIHSIISDNDAVVPPAFSLALAEKLGSFVHKVAGGGHLMGDDGFFELPQAWQAAQSIVAAQPLQ